MSPAQALQFRLERAGNFELPAVWRGPAEGPVVLLVPPLFEEMNRCRRLLADLGRALAARDIATMLPDLPGTGDSLTGGGFENWRSAVAALTARLASDRPTWVASFRGGSLLSDGEGSFGLYRFSIVTSGSTLLRDMMRAQAIADQERTGGKVALSSYEARLAAGETVVFTGYPITPALAAELAAAALPAAAVKCRQADVRSGSDFTAEGPPVWRQAEPAPTKSLAEALAADIAAWTR